MNFQYCRLVLMPLALLMSTKMTNAVDQPIYIHDKCMLNEHFNKILPSSENSSSRLFSKVVNMVFLIEEPDVCTFTRPKISLLIYVHSAPIHFKNRDLIRQTYGTSALYHELGTVTIFLVGRSEDPEVNRAVRLESDRYHDIIMADYIDDYQNLTMKAMSALTWIIRHCKQVPYVLKTDDDILVNVFNVVRHAKYLAKYKIDTFSKGHFHCNVTNASFINRENDLEVNFPEHCTSSAFLIPGSLVPILHNAIANSPYLSLDNVYVTGLLRVATGTIELNNIASVVADNVEEYMSKKDAINKDGLFGRLNGENGLQLMMEYWNDIWQKHQVEDNIMDTDIIKRDM